MTSQFRILTRWKIDGSHAFPTGRTSIVPVPDRWSSPPRDTTHLLVGTPRTAWLPCLMIMYVTWCHVNCSPTSSMFPSLTDNDAYMQKYDFFGDFFNCLVLKMENHLQEICSEMLNFERNLVVSLLRCFADVNVFRRKHVANILWRCLLFWHVDRS